jgi:hypothetical protein
VIYCHYGQFIFGHIVFGDKVIDVIELYRSVGIWLKSFAVIEVEFAVLRLQFQKE